VLLEYEHDIYEDTKEAFGTSCPGCSHINVDELYHEIEEEPGYYEDLLAEDHYPGSGLSDDG